MDMGQLFLVILVGCFVFFLVSLIFGMDHGELGGGHDHGGHDGDGDGFMTDLFTLRNIFLFGVGFGALGSIANAYGAGPLVSSFAGTVAGVLMAVFGAWLFRLLRKQQANSVTSLETLVGTSARVTTTIPKGGRGEIATINEHGVNVTMSAQSSDEAIMENVNVTILSVVGNTATVKPL